jgi:hypothetical protein
VGAPLKEASDGGSRMRNIALRARSERLWPSDSQMVIFLDRAGPTPFARFTAPRIADPTCAKPLLRVARHAHRRTSMDGKKAECRGVEYAEKPRKLCVCDTSVFQRA